MLSVQVGFAQTNYQANFQKAKTQIELGNYEEAMDLLRPVLGATSSNPYASYATYFFALSAYEDGKYELAKTTLRPLLVPGKFDKIDEANYLMAHIYLAQNEYRLALDQLADIKSSSLKQQANTSFTNALVKLDKANLKQLYDQYRDESILKNALVQKLKYEASSKEELELLAALDPSETYQPVNQSKLINIGAFLPFMYGRDSAQIARLVRENFVVDLYLGAKLAQEEINKSGDFEVNLIPFDTKRDERAIRTILQDEAVESLDVIFGPLYPNEFQQVSEFAIQHEIPFVNPLSTNSKQIENNNFAYLYKPGSENVALSTADFVAETWGGSNAAILYGSSSRDSLIAAIYARELEAKGINVAYKKRISTDNVKNAITEVILGYLPVEEENAEPIKEEDKNVPADHIYFVTEDPRLPAPIISALEINSSRIPVIASDAWLNFNFVSFEQLERLNFYFTSNSSLDYENKAVEEFRINYKKRFGAFPNPYAFIGYDLIYIITEQYQVNGMKNFLQGMPFRRGKISRGLDYSLRNDNQYVPMLKLESGKLVVLKQSITNDQE